MRRAIIATKVVLNTALTPGLILIPSSLIILKKKIKGFNNVLTMADYWMKFGENKTVNKVVVPPSPPVKKIVGSKPKQKSPEKKSPVRTKSLGQSPKRNVSGTSSRHQYNPFHHCTNYSLKGFTGRNIGGNFQPTNQKSNVGTGGDNTRQLMTLYGLSNVAGFAGLKVLTMIV